MNTFIDRVNSIVQQNQQPTMSAPTEPAYPDAGIGALENVANGVPRQTMISNQPHMLAYINPQEEQALRDMGGSGLPGPGGIPAYWWHDDEGPSFTESLSNFGNSIRDTASNAYDAVSNTASNAYDAVSTAATNTFGDQGSVETFFDTYVADFDQDSTPDTTVYGTGPAEVITTGPITYTDSNGVEHSTQAAADAANVILAARANPLNTTSTKTKEQLIAEARAAGQTVYAWNGNYEPVPDEVVEPVETTNSVVAQDLGQKFDQYGNSVRETIANLITPFDSAFFEDGTLYGYDKDGNVIDLTGGGESYNSLTGTSNYVYGVSDDPTTGTALDTIGMSDDEVSTAQVSDELLRDIPPSDLAYFATFFGNNVLPIFGGELAGMMLDSGIEERRAYMNTEIAALEAGATPTYNAAGEYTGHDTGATDQYNLNYDPTGGNAGTTATGALPTATAEDAAASKAAGEEAAASMKEAGILTVGGKQTPDDPDNVGNTPIFQYNGSDGSYEVVGGLTEGADATLSTNADGTLFIPYDGEDPHTITADTAFIGSTDPNAADYNMSLDLAENGSYVNLDGDTVTGDAFETMKYDENGNIIATNLTPNGAAVANVVGKNILLTTGDDSKMVLSVEGGGYKLVDGTPLTNKVLENIITEGVNDGTLSADLLDTFDIDGGTGAASAQTFSDGDPVIKSIYNRFRISGSTAGLPFYMSKWMDGVDFDERLEKVMVDGKVMYKNTEGDVISAEDLKNALKYDDDGNIIETEE